MAYGHAERNLDLIRGLEAETRQLLRELGRLDAEQQAWLEAADGGTTGMPGRRSSHEPGDTG